MKCIHPVVIRNPKYQSRPLTEPTHVMVPCGHCAACLTNRSNAWSFRIEQELKRCTNAYFVTLTYHERCLPKYKGVPVVSREDIRKFHYRLRKDFAGIRYFFFAEYSPEPLYRPHYHCIYFNLDVPQDCLHVAVKQYLSKYWKYGIVDVRDVDVARIKYCANYSVSKAELPDFYKQKKTQTFFLCSQHFGENYLTDKVRNHLKQNLLPRVSSNQYLLSLPRYYREKVYDDKEKSVLHDRAMEYNQSEKEKYSDSEIYERWQGSKEYEINYFERHKKRSRYLTRSIE